MSAKIRKIIVSRRGDAGRRWASRCRRRRAGRRRRRDRESLRRTLSCEDLKPLIDIGEELGALLAERCVEALGIPGGKAESYGKAAIVGENGELEHAAAILHPQARAAGARKVLEKGAALIPSAKKRGGPGTPVDVPLGHKDAAFVRSHFDAHGGARRRCAARQRDRGRRRRHRQRPAAAARRRLAEA